MPSPSCTTTTGIASTTKSAPEAGAGSVCCCCCCCCCWSRQQLGCCQQRPASLPGGACCCSAWRWVLRAVVWGVRQGVWGSSGLRSVRACSAAVRRETQMYYGGDPPAWTLEPAIPAEARFPEGAAQPGGSAARPKPGKALSAGWTQANAQITQAGRGPCDAAITAPTGHVQSRLQGWACWRMPCSCRHTSRAYAATYPGNVQQHCSARDATLHACRQAAGSRQGPACQGAAGRAAGTAGGLPDAVSGADRRCKRPGRGRRQPARQEARSRARATRCGQAAAALLRVRTRWRARCGCSRMRVCGLLHALMSCQLAQGTCEALGGSGCTLGAARTLCMQQPVGQRGWVQARRATCQTRRRRLWRAGRLPVPGCKRARWPALASNEPAETCVRLPAVVVYTVHMRSCVLY